MVIDHSHDASKFDLVYAKIEDEGIIEGAVHVIPVLVWTNSLVQTMPAGNRN